MLYCSTTWTGRRYIGGPRQCISVSCHHVINAAGFLFALYYLAHIVYAVYMTCDALTHCCHGLQGESTNNNAAAIRIDTWAALFRTPVLEESVCVDSALRLDYITAC